MPWSWSWRGRGHDGGPKTLPIQLGLEHVSEQLPKLLEPGVRQKLTLPRFLRTVYRREQEFREERRVGTGLKTVLPAGGETADLLEGLSPCRGFEFMGRSKK